MPEDRKAGDTAKTHQIPEEDLKRILLTHGWWLDSEGAKGHQADLRAADLREFDLFRVDLRRAVLEDADLEGADL